MNLQSIRKSTSDCIQLALENYRAKSIDHSRRAHRTTGFTLIELLIVVAIVGIIAGIAYPSYGAFVVRTKRSDAHLALLNAQQSMERCKATNYSYVGCALPAGYATSPEDYFELVLTPVPTATTYTISAKPAGSHKDADCPAITIDEAGAKLPVACWD